jgi:ribulose-5-phosphate 4-epimerase/fuculose-1-phosphate aldolase
MVLEHAIRDLVIANRILAFEGVVDAYGHVSVRHPMHADRFLLSRSRSAALVEPDDIMEFLHDGTAVNPTHPPYVERFIHGAVYKARPEIMAVIHSHATEVLPYSISTVPLVPVIHSAGMIGMQIPVWDIRDRFGDTNMLVVNGEQGDDLAARLAGNSVVLMRGHGFTAAGRGLMEVIRMAVYLRVNAGVLSDALRLGPVRTLSQGEVDRITDVSPAAPEVKRAWQYWATRAGCGGLLDKE